MVSNVELSSIRPNADMRKTDTCESFACRLSDNGSKNWRSILRKFTEAEMERKKVAKVARTMIRLKHSLRADEEINERLPETLGAFDAALERGELQEIQAVLGDVL